MELTLFTNILNIIWYIFTVLFLLYKFTSFFTYMYNFVKFCGKLFKGIFYLKDQVKIYFVKRNSYSISERDLEMGPCINEEHTNTRQNQSVLSKIKHTFNILYNSDNYILKEDFPLIETNKTTLLEINPNSDDDDDNDNNYDTDNVDDDGDKKSENTDEIIFKEKVINKFVKEYNNKNKDKKKFNKHISKIMRESIDSDKFNTVRSINSNSESAELDSNVFLESNFIEKVFDKSKGDWLKTNQVVLNESFEGQD